MATFTHREIVSRRVEYIVPAAAPWGACLGDMQAAMNAARIACVERNGLDPARPLADTALRFEPRDDEIVISFIIEEVQ
jgi:hypothetical protein